MNEIIIRREDRISEIQDQFNKYFSFLKIEFFRQAPVSGIGNSKNKMIVDDLKMEQIKGFTKGGSIELNNNTIVSTLEKYFETNCGLYVQIFRKSGKVWLETTATDNWTLQQQNEEGKSLAKQLNVEQDNPDDHDIY
jgi:hypothetical protein